jgi:hypothetical protein
MMTKIMQYISLVTSVRKEDVWIYLCNLDPTDMIEYGTRFARARAGRRPGLKVFPGPSGPIWRSWEQQKVNFKL